MKIIFFILALVISSLCFSQQELPKIKWYTIKEAQELVKTSPKKILIDMNTSWCGWCKKMDKETFDNPSIASYVNTFFIPVKFDAETHDTIVFNGKTYFNKQTGNRATHDLAIELLNGKLSYPTIVYLDENLNMLSPVPGYMTPRDIEPLLIFFARNIYKATPYDEFKNNFSATYIDSSAYKKKPFAFTNFSEYAVSNKKTPKNTIIYLTADWCPECKVMQMNTFSDSLIADYLGKNYNVIYFNALSQDSIVFNNVTYKNQNSGHPFHDLAVTLLNGKMDFPVMIFMTESGELISPVPGYFTPRNLEPVLHFFFEKAYKTTQWDKYIQTFKSSYK